MLERQVEEGRGSVAECCTTRVDEDGRAAEYGRKMVWGGSGVAGWSGVLRRFSSASACTRAAEHGRKMGMGEGVQGHSPAARRSLGPGADPEPDQRHRHKAQPVQPSIKAQPEHQVQPSSRSSQKDSPPEGWPARMSNQGTASSRGTRHETGVSDGRSTTICRGDIYHETSRRGPEGR